MKKKYGVEIEFDVAAPMRDGVSLRSNIYRPTTSGSYPVVLCRTPYGKDGSLGPILDPLRLAREGYIVVLQDVRGRGRSEGVWIPFKHEGVDGYDSVQWVAKLPCSSGNVGMVGASYVGFTQWAAALEAPPQLKAIVPVVTFADAYDGFFERGGALEYGLLANWLLNSAGMDVLARRAATLTTKEYNDVWQGLADEIDALSATGYSALSHQGWSSFECYSGAKELLESLDTSTRLAYASPFGEPQAYAKIRVPALNVGGWYDIFARGTLRNFHYLQQHGTTLAARRAKLVMGPWTHTDFGSVIGEYDFGLAAAINYVDSLNDLTELTRRWFDYWLKGLENGIDDEPPVKLFVMGENRWHHKDTWPANSLQRKTFYLRGGGRLSSEPPNAEMPDHYEYNFANPIPTSGGATFLHGTYRAGVRDQRTTNTRADVLTYTSEPLTQPLEVIGSVKAHLWATSDLPVTDFIARLIDVHPDGFARNLNDGILRVRHAHVKAYPTNPLAPSEYVVDLWATANTFGVGHRVQLQLANTSSPRWNFKFGLRGAETTTSGHIAIFHDLENLSYLSL